MSRPLVSAIVVAYGPDGLVRDSLAALRAALAEVDGDTELIVVLNRADGQTRIDLEQSCETVVDPGGNLGFAGGVNAGIARATGEWIALVNDDCVVEPFAIQELVIAGRAAPDIGSVAAQVRFVNNPDTINSAGIEVDVLGVARERLLGAPAGAGERTPTDVFGASAAAALYRRSMLEEIGGFAESFFAYLEDVDVAWRARAAGWRCVYAPAAIALHHHSASLGHASARKHFLVGRNRVRLLARNATTQHLVRYGLAIALYDLAYISFVGLRARSMAPLKGRAKGITCWQRDRETSLQRPVSLARTFGFRRALERDRWYSA